ncbi:hypothetical protein ACJIZ3_019216 [Penstemon smallii]|uniref:Uncharacterized protein n=1 Tax=Penstemon smallii TaxID=265156 RepID=A0ABD3T0J6_9LAMI
MFNLSSSPVFLSISNHPLVFIIIFSNRHEPSRVRCLIFLFFLIFFYKNSYFYIGVNAVGFGRITMKKSTRPNTCGLPNFQTAPVMLFS